MLRIPPRPLVALSFVVTLAGAGPAAAQQRIPAAKSPAAAEADDGMVKLPDGIVLVGGCELVARRGRVEAVVANLDSSHGEIGSCPVLLGVVLHDDGALVAETSWEQRISVSRAHLHSRLELAAGLKLAKKKQQQREAEQAIERALALDPAFEEAAFALARVRLGLGEAERAAAALAPFLAQEPLRICARTLSDRKLHPLVNQEPFVAVRAQQAGTARIADHESPIIAYAADRKLFAVVQSHRMGDALAGGDPFESNLLVFDATGIHASLLLFVQSNDVDRRKERAALGRRVEIANQFLAAFGFMPIADAERVTFQVKPTGTEAAPFPRARMSLAFRDGMARVLQGDQVLHERRIHEVCTGRRGDSGYLCEYPPAGSWAAWLPGLNTMLFEWVGGGAEGVDYVTVIEVWPLGSPGGRVIMPPGEQIPR